MTLQELIQQKCPTSTCSSADCLVSPILRHQEIQEDLSIPEEFYSLKLPELSKTSDLRLFAGECAPAPSASVGENLRNDPLHAFRIGVLS